MTKRPIGPFSWPQPASRRPRLLILLAGALGALCLLLPAATPVFAADPGRMITIGESNTAAQRDELLAYFRAGGDDSISDVTLADTQRAMDGIIEVSDITSAYSSTALTCRPVGTGLEVTTRNIEVVPPELYAMALATAGIHDATLVVAAPDDAPAEGMTALTGVFQTWDIAPCGGASLDPERQALALEELALAMRIGEELGGDAGPRDATALLLLIQQAIIVEVPEGRAGVVDAIEDQERATGIQVPDAELDELVDLMARLASDRIAWGSFSEGWRLTRGDEDDRVTLRALTADESSDAEAPTPTATPAAATLTVTGTVDGTDGGQVVVGDIAGQGGSVAYPMADSVTVRRQGQAATLDDILPGDTVTMTVDSTTGRATAIDAESAAAPVGASTSTAASDSRSSSGLLGLLGGIGLIALLIAGLLLFLRRRRNAAPVISFTPRTKPAVVTTIRERVASQTARVDKTSWYRARHRPGHSDGSAD